MTLETNTFSQFTLNNPDVFSLLYSTHHIKQRIYLGGNKLQQKHLYPVAKEKKTKQCSY